MLDVKATQARKKVAEQMLDRAKTGVMAMDAAAYAAATSAEGENLKSMEVS